MARVITYIDGQSLYHGLKEKGWLEYMWLDIDALSRSFMDCDDGLMSVKYFSVHIAHPEEKRQAFTAYHSALETRASVRIFYGKLGYSDHPCALCGTSCRMICPNCKWEAKVPRIKRVNEHICVEMLTDAFKNSYDKAYLLSANNDLIVPIQAIKDLRPEKRIILALAPTRGRTHKLQDAAHEYFYINETAFRRSQLPNKLKARDGTALDRPARWSP